MMWTGAADRRLPGYWDMRFFGDQAALLARLEEGRAILVTPVLKERLGVREGDLLALETRRGKRDYRVAGFFDSVMQNGSYALVSQRNMRADFAQKHYGVLYVRAAGEAGQAAAEIERKLGRRRAWIRTIDQLSEENYRSNEQIFRILQGFSVMILLIAVVGVFNNFVVSFLARRRSMAVLFSVGMSRRQGAGTLLIEAGSGGLIGGATGISAGFLLIRTVPAVLRAVNLSVTPVTPGRCS